MPTVSGLKSIISGFISLAKDLREQESRDRRKFFDVLIEPSFEVFEKVHYDYVSNFGTLRRVLLRDEWPSNETVEWLFEASKQYLVERDRLRAVPGQSRQFKKFFDDKSILHSDNSDIQREFSKYCSAIREYFDAGHFHINFSWYTGFIGILEKKVEIFQNQFEDLTTRENLPEDSTGRDVLKLLKSGKYPSAEVQREFDEGAIFDPHIGQGTGIDAEQIRIILRALNNKFTQASRSRDTLAMLCSAGTLEYRHGRKI